MTTGSETVSEQQDVEYSIRFVAFLDVLGWRKMVERSVDDPYTRRELRAGLHLSSWLALGSPMTVLDGFEGHEPKRVEVNQFSDSIVISAEADQRGWALFVAYVLFITRAWFNNGFLVRGGITVGRLYHETGYAFGPALTHAYDLEQKAKFPRVLLDPDFENKVADHCEIEKSVDSYLVDLHIFATDNDDGHRFVDILSTPTLYGFGGGFNYGLASIIPALEIIKKGLSQAEAGSDIHQKYVWLANYYNRTLTTMKAQGQHMDLELLDPAG